DAHNHFLTFLEEVRVFSMPKLGETLTTNPPTYVSLRNQIFPYDFSRLRLVELKNPPNTFGKVLTVRNMMENAGEFRSELGLALGLGDTARMIRIISLHNYILTPDFGLKLLLIHDRLSNGENLLLKG